MTDCKRIAEQLIAYADDELPAAESEAVAGHLAQCGACQAELRRLERSLELARDVWATAVGWAERSESHQEPDTEPRACPTALTPGPSPASGRGVVLRRLAYAAAAAVLVAIGVWCLREPSSRVAIQTPAEPPADVEQVEQIVSRAERAARLRASMEILANQPGLEKYYAEAKQYYESNFGPEPDRDANDSVMN